jgi:RNA polymerase sigma factor (sigma-70 family)
MMKVIRQYVADYDMAQDVLHDGFLVILSQIQNLRNAETLEYWMATIMKNLSLHCLSQIRFDNILDEPECEADADEVYNLSYEDLLALIDRLPNGYRTVFRLAVLEGKSHQEIAEMLGITPHSSASQLARAKEKLRQLILEHNHKAGLLALLVLLMSGTYLIYRNALLDVDLHPDLTEAKKTNEQVPSLSNEETSTPAIASVQVMNDTQELVSAISPNVSDEMQASLDSISAPKDTIKSVTDTTIIVPTRPSAMPDLIADEDFPPIKHSSVGAWKIRMATNALGLSSDGNRGDVASGSMSDPSTSGGGYQETELSTSVHHLMPITLGIRFSKEISPSWTVETGLEYTLLRSEITKTMGNWSYMKNIRANYLSLPIAVSYNLMQINRTNMYVSGGVSLDIPVGASINSEALDEHKSLKYPVSVSPRMGLGFEYKISPSSMLFVQPTLSYHFMKDSDYPILWQDKPASFELPVGIRFSW